MSKQMMYAVEMMAKLNMSLKGISGEDISNIPEFVCLSSFKKRLYELGHHKMKVATVEKIIDDITVEISMNTEHDVAEFLGSSIAETVFEVWQKFGESEFWEFISKALTVRFDPQGDE